MEDDPFRGPQRRISGFRLGLNFETLQRNAVAGLPRRQRLDASEVSVRASVISKHHVSPEVDVIERCSELHSPSAG